MSLGGWSWGVAKAPIARTGDLIQGWAKVVYSCSFKKKTNKKTKNKFCFTCSQLLTYFCPLFYIHSACASDTGSSRFPLPCSRRKEAKGRVIGQSVPPHHHHHHSPEVDNGELTYYSDSDFWIQLPCAGKPVKQAADWGPCRKAHPGKAHRTAVA